MTRGHPHQPLKLRARSHALQNVRRSRPALVLALLVGLLLACACSRSNGVRAVPSVRPRVQPGTSVSFGFDAATPGPAGNPYEISGVRWSLRAESGAPSPPDALCRMSPDDASATVIVPSPDYVDLTDSVSLEPLGGSGYGLILRAQDADDYYLVAADAVAGRVSIEIERRGARTVLASVTAPVQANAWQELSAQMRGAEITAFLNGRGVAHADDAAFTHGSIGLWSAANASACFDNLMATGL